MYIECFDTHEQGEVMEPTTLLVAKVFNKKSPRLQVTFEREGFFTEDDLIDIILAICNNTNGSVQWVPNDKCTGREILVILDENNPFELNAQIKRIISAILDTLDELHASLAVISEQISEQFFASVS